MQHSPPHQCSASFHHPLYVSHHQKEAQDSSVHQICLSQCLSVSLNLTSFPSNSNSPDFCKLLFGTHQPPLNFTILNLCPHQNNSGEKTPNCGKS